MGVLISQSSVLSFGAGPLGCALCSFCIFTDMVAHLVQLNATDSNDIIPSAVSPGAAFLLLFFFPAHVHANVNGVIFI